MKLYTNFTRNIPQIQRLNNMVTKLRRDWARKLHTALGYMVVEDDESLRALNACIKGIVQSERQRKKVGE